MQRPTGMKGFAIVWVGQLLSMLGSGMTRFGLILWLYEETGSATSLGLLGMTSLAPTIFLAPLAGVFIDRLGRKLSMMLSDLGAVLGTLCLLLLYLTGDLRGWHLYVLGFWSGAFESFQWPAYQAAVSTMVEKANYSRANGLLSLAGSASMIVSPMLAALILKSVGLLSILVIDLCSFFFALGTLSWIRIPDHRNNQDKDTKK